MQSLSPDVLRYYNNKWESDPIIIPTRYMIQSLLSQVVKWYGINVNINLVQYISCQVVEHVTLYKTSIIILLLCFALTQYWHMILLAELLHIDSNVGFCQGCAKI